MSNDKMEEAPRIRNRRSLHSIQVVPCDDSGEMASATAFYLSYEEQLYLVTNWHVVSGKDFVKKELLVPSRQPEYLLGLIKHIHPVGTENGLWRVRTDEQKIDIYDEHDQPLWFEHPDLGSDCDVVALPIDQLESTVMHKPISLELARRIPLRPGSTVFAIGFPHSISVPPGFPIWKSGYIASEFEFGIELKYEHLLGQQLPAFYIDSQTRKGMSGAPIFAQYSGMWDPDNPYGSRVVESAIIGDGDEFIGCYTGRSIGNADEAALGICWTKAAIEEICRAKRKRERP